ncbi:MAG: GNAT family N-acetyltransferase [Armatimonadetes bacterium]|nr:GNAT family N-acetyltransferase [Armatimonadota bacterium]
MHRIRGFQPEDLPRLRELTIQCFDGVSIDQNIERELGTIAGIGWQERKAAHIEEDCRVNPAGVFVVEVQGDVVGYISTRLNPSTRIGWIPNLAVDPRFRRHGLARALFAHAFAYLRASGMLAVRIETLEQNAVGRAFYPQLGFRETARQIHYVKPLTEEP